MSEPIRLFQNYNLNETVNDRARPISFTQNWLGVLLQVTAAAPGFSARVRVQWSDTGAAPWFDGGTEDDIATITAPGTYIKSMPIRACYWRVRAEVAAGSPIEGMMCSGTALV